jgi:hypothetical protein
LIRGNVIVKKKNVVTIFTVGNELVHIIKLNKISETIITLSFQNNSIP